MANYGLRVTNTIKRTVNTGSQQTAATDASTEYIRVAADTDGVFIAFGANPTATTSSSRKLSSDVFSYGRRLSSDYY